MFQEKIETRRPDCVLLNAFAFALFLWNGNWYILNVCLYFFALICWTCKPHLFCAVISSMVSLPLQYTGLFEMIFGVLRTCHPVLQMQPHLISFYGVTSRIRFTFLLFPQVSLNWRSLHATNSWTITDQLDNTSYILCHFFLFRTLIHPSSGPCDFAIVWYSMVSV